MQNVINLKTHRSIQVADIILINITSPKSYSRSKTLNRVEMSLVPLIRSVLDRSCCTKETENCLDRSRAVTEQFNRFEGSIRLSRQLSRAAFHLNV